MDFMEAMRTRHSVRAYLDRPVEREKLAALQERIDTLNRDCALHIQLVTNEPQAFDSRMAHYGKFSNVRNYLVLAGQKRDDLDERCGYCGEQLVLLAQQLGLNSCWVGLTFRKNPSAFTLAAGEKLVLVIALGYGASAGTAHKSKTAEQVADTAGAPAWFLRGVEAALLAPTAMNQQKFRFTLSGGKATAKAGLGFFSKVDLGIVKYHFELGAGEDFPGWAE